MQDLTQANEVYLGHMVQNKTGTVSYKVHKQVSKPKADWIKVEHTHEPLTEPCVRLSRTRLLIITFAFRITSHKSLGEIVALRKPSKFNQSALAFL